MGSSTPAFLGVVAAVAAAKASGDGGGGGGAGDENRGMSHNRNPPSPRRKMSSEQDASSVRSRREDSAASTTAASTEREVGGGGTGRGRSKIPEASSASRSRPERVQGTGSPRSDTSCSSDGGDGAGVIGGQSEDVVGDVGADSAGNERPSLSEEPGVSTGAAIAASSTAAAATALSEGQGEMPLQPRRPSDQRPSKLLEGNRPSRTNTLSIKNVPHDVGRTITMEVGASSPNGVRRSISGEPVAHGGKNQPARSSMSPSGATAAFSSKASPTAAGTSGCVDAKFAAVSCLEEDDKNSGGGDVDKLSPLVDRNEADGGPRKFDIEEYNSDAFEGDGEISLTH